MEEAFAGTPTSSSRGAQSISSDASPTANMAWLEASHLCRGIQTSMGD